MSSCLCGCSSLCYGVLCLFVSRCLCSGFCLCLVFVFGVGVCVLVVFGVL